MQGKEIKILPHLQASPRFAGQRRVESSPVQNLTTQKVTFHLCQPFHIFPMNTKRKSHRLVLSFSHQPHGLIPHLLSFLESADWHPMQCYHVVGADSVTNIGIAADNFDDDICLHPLRIISARVRSIVVVNVGGRPVSGREPVGLTELIKSKSPITWCC